MHDEHSFFPSTERKCAIVPNALGKHSSNRAHPKVVITEHKTKRDIERKREREKEEKKKKKRRRSICSLSL